MNKLPSQVIPLTRKSFPAYFINTILFLLTMMVTSFSPHPSQLSLLSDPFLQFPTETTVRVVWFTEFPGTEHKVIYGENLDQVSIAQTIKLSRTREDENSKVTPPYSETKKRDIWRHEGEVTGLEPGNRVPYQVISIVGDRFPQETVKSQIFSLASQPSPGTPLKILLTSDHQLMPMVAANLQKVAEAIGKVDGIFFAGDLVNIPDRASEWFDDNRGGAFFPCLQGRANYSLQKEGITTVYQGSKLIQYAPLFPTIGNHEVMGKFSEKQGLNQQFDNAFPRQQAEKLYLENAAKINSQPDWIKDNSFNTDTYQEIFSFPPSGNKKYYAVSFGDIRLVVLQVTNIWRSPSLEANVRGRYQEAKKDLENPQNWGYGQHIFEPITPDSPQYQWLEEELQSQEFKQAKYKIVMFHHPPHTLGGNIVPPYTDPVSQINYAADGTLQSVRYEYPRKDDYIIRDLIPLLESAKVNLIFFGHSHLWNRFISPKGTHFLETSNVGNTYGSHVDNNKRPIPPDYSPSDYLETGDPNGLDPIVPNLAPLVDDNHQPLPYVASNDITVFSILDTQQGTVSSYRFDTRYPNSDVIKFDEFSIKG